MPCPSCYSENISHYSWCQIHKEDLNNLTNWKEVNQKKAVFKEKFLKRKTV